MYALNRDLRDLIRGCLNAAGLPGVDGDPRTGLEVALRDPVLGSDAHRLLPLVARWSTERGLRFHLAEFQPAEERLRFIGLRRQVMDEAFARLDEDVRDALGEDLAESFHEWMAPGPPPR